MRLSVTFVAKNDTLYAAMHCEPSAARPSAPFIGCASLRQFGRGILRLSVSDAASPREGPSPPK